MSLVDKVQIALLSILNTELDKQFVVDFSNIPEGSETYGSLGIVSSYQKHKTERHFRSTEDKYVEEIKETHAVLVTVQTIGDFDYSLIESAYSLFKFSDIIEELVRQDISLVDIGTIKRVPEKRDTTYIARASFDIQLYTTVVYQRKSDWIDEVAIQEDVYDIAGSKVIDKELRIKRSGK